MTSPIAPIPTGPTPAPAPSNGAALNRDDFLQLLVAQLRHQDPLNPMDGSQFASELAQFSSLEQLININEGLESQMGTDFRTQLVLNTTLGTTLIGRDVLATDNLIDISGAGSHAVTVDVGDGGGAATIDIFDANGVIVATQSVGTVSGGEQQRLTFDLDANLPPGSYRYQVTVTASDGTDVPVGHYTTGTVEGVFFGADGVVLRVGDHLRIPLDRLAEIEPVMDE